MAIKEFIDSISRALGNMDLATIEPMNYLIFHPLFDKQWVRKIEQVYKKIKEEGIPMEIVAKKIRGLSHLRVQYYFFLMDLKSARIKKYRRKQLAAFFHDLMCIKAKDDVYGLQSNIVHTKSEIKEILARRFEKASPEIARNLGMLYNAAYHFVNGLYTDFYTDYGAENCGAYELDKDRLLVIKHFEDLSPQELWHEISSPCKKLTIYAIYKNIKFSCDSVSVHSVYDGDPIAGLVEYRMEKDGKQISMKDVKEMIPKMEKLAAEQWQRLLSLDQESLKRKGLEMRGYIFRDLFDIMKMGWKPSQAMIAAVKNKPSALSAWNPPEEKQAEYWKRIMDPDDEFYG